jgi:hypothetical protein
VSGLDLRAGSFGTFQSGASGARLSRFAANGSAEVSEPDDRTRPDQIKVFELLGRNLAVQADLGLMEVPGDP